jgi:dTDP-4-amino-4,6-dideoxygalactose transaminase
MSTPKLSRRRESFLSFQPPAVGEDEIEAVAETIRSGWLTTGPRTADLEERFAAYTGAKHAIALSSGTAALHLSLLALGVGPGDEVITTPITWPATANVIVHAGATPVFVDVKDDDLNIDPGLARTAVTQRTKAVMPVDLAGQPADLDPLLELGFPVIEDAAHAAESVYRGRKVGSIVDATCFSLYATKNITAGEGGIVTTDRDDVADAIRERRLMRRGHGTLYDIGVPRRSRSSSSRRSTRTARSASVTSRSTTRRSPSSTGSRRSRAIRATSTRCTCTSSASTPSARARRATSIRRR